MILPRADSIKPPSSVDQKPALSRLSKRELEEVHAAPTRYPQQDHHAADAQSPSDRTSEHSSQKSATQKSSSTPLSDSLDNTKKSEGQQFKSVVTDQEKEGLVEDSNSDGDQSNDGLHHDLGHLPSASSLAGGVAALLSQVKLFFQPDRPSVSLDDDGSIVPITAAINSTMKKEDEETLLSRLGVTEESVLPSLNKKVATDPAVQDAGDDTGSNGTQHEWAHEVTHKMVEGEENNATMTRSAAVRAEIAPVTGSAGSSGADLSDPVAAALRVTHLLDELTAAVSRLRLDSSDGKEMTIQLRREVLPETNIHIVSTTKQMEVSFLTSNAASDLLLNTHLTTLQNHLNSLCPGQVVSVQTQLTPSSGSSQMGSEQEQSHDDLASFEQGNRGNEAREE